MCLLIIIFFFLIENIFFYFLDYLKLKIRIENRKKLSILKTFEYVRIVGGCLVFQQRSHFFWLRECWSITLSCSSRIIVKFLNSSKFSTDLEGMRLLIFFFFCIQPILSFFDLVFFISHFFSFFFFLMFRPLLLNGLIWNV